MTGGLLQLAAYGAQNVYLTGSPQITFFIAVYKRHTNFAMESIQKQFHGRVTFGAKVYCDVDPDADLVNSTFLQIKLPNLRQIIEDYDENPTSWVNNIGNAILQYVDIEIGGTVIDRQYGQWLDIWSQLTLKSEKEYGYDTMVGKKEHFTPTSQPGPLNLYIPFQFWFNRNIGLSLPLISLQYSKVRYHVKFRELSELLVSATGKLPNECTEEKINIDASLWIDYIFLENDERRKFASCTLEYLIEQLQVNTEGVDDKTVVVNLDFNHPVKELIWVLQVAKYYQDQEANNYNYFNYSSGEPEEINGDTIEDGKLEIEGKDRFREREAKYFRIIQPYQYHTRVPKNYIYVYSFAYRPEDHQPTGTCNFSKIDNATLHLTLNDCVVQKETQIIIYATNYNVLKIEGGIAGILYTN